MLEAVYFGSCAFIGYLILSPIVQIIRRKK